MLPLLLATLLLLTCNFTTSVPVSLNAHVDNLLEVLPDFSSEDVLEVYHLRSARLPILTTAVGTFKAQSAGLAIRNINGGETMVLQFTPANMTACYFPMIIAHDNAVESSKFQGTLRNTDLVWDKRSVIQYEDKIDLSYWQESTYLTDIDGRTWVDFITWLKGYILQNRVYNPQSICDSLFPRDDSTCFSYSQTWDSFVQHCFKHLAENAVKLTPINPPAASDLVLLSNTEPQRIDFDKLGNKSGRQEVTDYYTELMACFRAITMQPGNVSNNKLSIIPDIAEALNTCFMHNSSYIYIDGDNYLKIEIVQPYATMHEYFQPIPMAEDWDKEDDDKVEETFDKFIAVFILGGAFIGLIASLIRLKVYELWIPNATKIYRRNNRTRTDSAGSIHHASPIRQSSTSNWRAQHFNATSSRSHSESASPSRFSTIEYKQVDTEDLDIEMKTHTPRLPPPPPSSGLSLLTKDPHQSAPVVVGKGCCSPVSFASVTSETFIHAFDGGDNTSRSTPDNTTSINANTYHTQGNFNGDNDNKESRSGSSSATSGGKHDSSGGKHDSSDDLLEEANKLLMDCS